MTRAPTDTGGEAAEYTIDELAAASRVPSRTIRFYQSKGALGPPERRGRVAFYGPDHLRRLELIAKLQDRGLRIDAIRDLVGRIDRGELDVAEWLGLEKQLRAPWTDDKPRSVTEDELYALLGPGRAGVLAELERTELVVREGDGYRIPSPALVRIALKLEAEGVPVEAAAAAAGIIRENMVHTATELAAYFVEHAVELHREGRTRDFSALLEALRPSGMEAIGVIFGQEMEQVLQGYEASGRSRLPQTPR